MAEEREPFEVGGSTDKPVSNVLEKARYKFIVKEVTPHQSPNNKCAKVVLQVEHVKITEYLVLTGEMSYKWRQFLFAIGIRDKREKWTVNPALIEGKEGLVDLGIKPNFHNPEDNDNYAMSYSPIKEESAPVAGVPAEEEVASPNPEESELEQKDEQPEKKVEEEKKEEKKEEVEEDDL